MIIVKLMGGLGNQMFQYAFSLYLKNQKSEIYFDKSFFYQNFANGVTPRTFELSAYGIECEEKGKIFFGNKIVKRILKKLSKYKLIPVRYFNEVNISESISSSIEHYEGYWQDIKYLLPNHNRLRKDFDYSHKLIGLNKERLDKIEKSTATAIHIRRGDYITNAAASDMHGICTLDYYKKGLDEVLKTVDCNLIVIFSDDIEWCKKNMEFDIETIFIEGNDKDPHADICLMSKCSAHIIANSSFSWWGAFLSHSQKVIYPSKWFASEKESPKIFLDSWIKI